MQNDIIVPGYRQLIGEGTKGASAIATLQVNLTCMPINKFYVLSIR
jgi:hypothetical protein